MRLDVVYRPVGGLRLSSSNPRTHSKAQIEQIAKSIASFGFVNPALIDAEGEVIAGHGRVLAAKKLRLTEIPTITLPHLSETEKRALRLADNRIAQNSAWDAEVLKLELEALSLPELEFDFDVLGFSSSEIDLALTPKLDAEEETAHAGATETDVRPGDIWQLGPHRIGCGDARDPAFLARVMDGARADVAFLDPPYNLGIRALAAPRSGHREFLMGSGEMTPAEFEAFIREGIETAVGFSRSGAVHFLCCDWRHLATLLSVTGHAYGALLNLCVWTKSNAGLGSLYRSQHEFVLVCRVGAQSHFNAIQLGRNGRHRSNVWAYPSVTSPRGSRRADLELHPTTKPTSLVMDAITDVSRRGDVVLDTFVGSGSTLVACERAGRFFRGVELDPLYVQTALDRWSAITGAEARRVQTIRRKRAK
jgi:hypothetical protein